ncbi:hypothetical protein ACJJTC_002085 [Scirpophaga incertulas]
MTFTKSYGNNDDCNPLNLQKRIDGSLFPPCKAEVQQHFLRTAYIAHLWSHAHRAMPTDLLPTEYGWEESEEKYYFKWFTGDQLPLSITSITNLDMNPHESICTYFMKAVPTSKSATGRYIPAKGKLVDKVRNLLYISGAKRRNRNIADSVKNDDFPDPEKIIVSEKINNDIFWLKHNKEPWDHVIEKWINTFAVRSRQTFNTVDEYLEEWSILKCSKGDILDAGDSTIIKQKEKAAVRGITVQPYVLIQGPLHNFSQIYIIIDDVRYHMQSAEKAFDLLFKLYHVFHAKYPQGADCSD